VWSLVEINFIRCLWQWPVKKKIETRDGRLRRVSFFLSFFLSFFPFSFLFLLNVLIMLIMSVFCILLCIPPAIWKITWARYYVAH